MTQSELKSFVLDNREKINKHDSPAFQSEIDYREDWDDSDRAQVVKLCLKSGWDISIENPLKSQNNTFIGVYKVEELEDLIDKDYLSTTRDSIGLMDLISILDDPWKEVMGWDITLYDAVDLPQDFTPDVIKELERLGVKPDELIDVIKEKIPNKYADEIGSAAASAYVSMMAMAYADDLESQIRASLLEMFPVELDPKLIDDGYGHLSIQISGSYTDFAETYDKKLAYYADYQYYDFHSTLGRYTADNYSVEYNDNGVYPDENEFYTLFADELSAIKES